MLLNAAEKDILVRIAGGIWHRIGPKGVSITSAQIIPSVKGEKYFYCRKRPEEELKGVTTSDPIRKSMPKPT